MVMTLGQQRECTWCHWIEHLKTVKILNFMYTLIKKTRLYTNLVIRFIFCFQVYDPLETLSGDSITLYDGIPL